MPEPSSPSSTPAAPAPARAWFLARGQQRIGPLPEPELRALADRAELAPDTLLWTDGMPQWAPARAALPDLFPSLPPPVPDTAPPTAAPPTTRSYTPPPPQGDSTGGLIPYKNAPALMAYYAAVFSLLPIFPIGLIALGLGISGLKKRARHPEVKGAVHAWIGIIVGGGFGLLWLALTALLVIAIIADA